MFRKSLIVVLVSAFLTTSLGPIPKARADVLNLPIPGTMVNLSPAYEPVMIKGLTVHKDNPFLFDFIVDVGDSGLSVGAGSPGPNKGEETSPLQQEGEKLIKYFLAALAIPEKDLWVNLSPYEKDRTIPEELAKTDMGRDLLAQDYILKQITASLIYPEKQLGKTFWDKVYAKAQQLYGTTEVPVNTFNKVWIMADRAEVFERNNTAFVTDSHLKVMLEEDYLALQKHAVGAGSPGPNKGGETPPLQSNDAHSMASDIVRQIILPELEKEVNTGKNFANLRQIFNSLILASWYKKNLKEALLNQVYSNQGKVKGIELEGQGSKVKEEIYQQYLAAYKKGVFNYIKEDIDASKGTTIPRKYFSGGVQIDHSMAATPTVTHKLSRLAALAFTALFVMTTACAPKSSVNLPPAHVPLFQPSVGTGIQVPAKAEITPEQKRAERLKVIDEVLARIDAGKKGPQGKEIDLGFYREPAQVIDLLLEVPAGLLKITRLTGSSLSDGYYFSVLPGETLDGLLSWLAGQKKEASPDRAMASKPWALDDMTDIEVARMVVRIKQSMRLVERTMESADSIVQRYSTNKSRLTPQSTGSLQEARTILEYYLDVWKIDLEKLETVITGSSPEDYQTIVPALRADIRQARSLIQRIEALLREKGAAVPDRAMTATYETVIARLEARVKDKKPLTKADVESLATINEALFRDATFTENLIDVKRRSGVVPTHQENVERSVGLMQRVDALLRTVPSDRAMTVIFTAQAIDSLLRALEDKKAYAGHLADRDIRSLAAISNDVETMPDVDDAAKAGFKVRISRLLGPDRAMTIQQRIVTSLSRDQGILYVGADDERSREIQKTLRSAGFTVEVLNDAQKIQGLINDQQDVTKFGLVILDMPSLEGDAALQLAKAFSDQRLPLEIIVTSDTPVILPAELNRLRQTTTFVYNDEILGVIQKVAAIATSNAARRSDSAMAAKGGIDLNTNGMTWSVRKDGTGVEMNIDPAMIERIRREGIDSLTPVIFRVTPVASIWPLVGLEPPKKEEERLVGGRSSPDLPNPERCIILGTPFGRLSG